MPPETRNLPLITREALLRLVRGEGDDMTIDVIWTTGATVQRRRYEGWDDVVEYDEELVVTPGAVRMDRLNAGAPFLDSHRSWGLESVVGAVLPGTARIEGGQGFARVRLTSAPDAAPIVQRIMDGTVSAVSVGYRVHRYDITKAQGQRELWRAVDWEPMEISAVAMPADPGAHAVSTKALNSSDTCRWRRVLGRANKSRPSARPAFKTGTFMRSDSWPRSAVFPLRGGPISSISLLFKSAVSAILRSSSSITRSSQFHRVEACWTRSWLHSTGLFADLAAFWRPGQCRARGAEAHSKVAPV